MIKYYLYHYSAEGIDSFGTGDSIEGVSSEGGASIVGSASERAGFLVYREGVGDSGFIIFCLFCLGTAGRMEDIISSCSSFLPFYSLFDS